MYREKLWTEGKTDVISRVNSSATCSRPCSFRPEWLWRSTCRPLRPGNSGPALKSSMSRGNLGENGGGNQNLKRRPVAKS
jgi:hypothetical protein